MCRAARNSSCCGPGNSKFLRVGVEDCSALAWTRFSRAEIAVKKVIIRRGLGRFLPILGVSALLVGWGGSGAGASSSATLTVDVNQSFSGVNAIEGPITDTGCYAATTAINDAGGVLGNKMTCVNTDDKGDAADAVAGVDKLLASTSHLVAVLGPGNTSPATEPLFTRAKIPMFTNNTDPRYNNNSNPYFFRILPSDSLGGISLAQWAYQHGFTHAAGVFTTEVDSQTNVPSLVKGYKLLGGDLVTNLALAPDQSDYRTEAAALVRAKPDAIIADLDPQTAATFFANLKQADPHIPQIIMDSTGTAPQFESAVVKVLGWATFSKKISVQKTAPDTSSSGYQAYLKALKKSGQHGLLQFAPISYAYYGYDGIILDALAMTSHKTIDPSGSDILKMIVSMTHPGKAKVTVQTFPEGVKALKEGKKIYYLGAYGLINFNKHNNASAPFIGVRTLANRSLVNVGSPMSSSALSNLPRRTGL